MEEKPSELLGISASSSSLLHKLIISLSNPIQQTLANTPYTPPESSTISIKSTLLDLLPKPNSPKIDTDALRIKVRDFSLCCAALASAEDGSSPVISWVPRNLSVSAKSAFSELSQAVFCDLDGDFSRRIGDLDADLRFALNECKLAVWLMPDVLPLLKGVIKESAVDPAEDEFYAASARVPVVSAVLAAFQFRWLVTQVGYPYLGRLCGLVIPCGLTALDHWSPEVKGQAMIVFIHLARNVNAAELGWYEDAILDACCQNIASSDELWHHIVEMSVLMITCMQRSNPRSSWFERMLGEMLSHLERQPKNMERRISWLQLIEPVFNAMGLVLLAHFRRIFPLFFGWMHVDDDKTVVLVLQRVHTIMKLTWVRNTPYVERLVDKLTILYKESSVRKGREEIRTHIRQIFVLLQQCKAQQLEAAWNKHRDDPNLIALMPSSIKTDIVSVRDSAY
ncbi:hypothetical protein AAC387_Pa03g0128 [Persea americana]